MITKEFVLGAFFAALFVGQACAQLEQKQTLGAARTEYDSSSHDEAARLRYVTKLGRIREGHLQQYWKGERTPQSQKAAEEVNSELLKHPAPAQSDSKKLSRLLVGSWQSPRRVYIFRANGKWGSEDGPVSSSWRISGNQLIEDGSHGIIILIDQHYFIYSEKGSVYFHLRVQQ